MKKLRAVSVHTNHKKLDLTSVARAHESGYRVLVYTVNDADVAERLFGAGVDGLFTDNLREFARHFPEAIRAPASRVDLSFGASFAQPHVEVAQRRAQSLFDYRVIERHREHLRMVMPACSAHASRWPMCSASGPAISAPRKRPVAGSP